MPPNEKDAFYAINLLRTDKDLFIELLNDAKNKFDGEEWQLEGGQKLTIKGGKERIDQLIEEIKEKVTEKIPEVVWNPHLYNAARDHAIDIGEKGLEGHIGSDGSTLDARIGKYAKTYIKTSQSISFGPYNGGEAVLSLLLTENQELGLKDNLFDPLLRRVGICNHIHSKNNFGTVFVFAGECYRKGDIDKIFYKL